MLSYLSYFAFFGPAELTSNWIILLLIQVRTAQDMAYDTNTMLDTVMLGTRNAYHNTVM